MTDILIKSDTLRDDVRDIVVLLVSSVGNVDGSTTVYETQTTVTTEDLVGDALQIVTTKLGEANDSRETDPQYS